MTKMAAIPVYGKIPLKILFPGTRGIITRILGMKHQGLQPIIVCSSYYPGLTLTYFWQGQILGLNFLLLFNIEKCHSDGFFENFAAQTVTWKLVDMFTQMSKYRYMRVFLSFAKHYIDVTFFNKEDISSERFFQQVQYIYKTL